MSTLEEQKQIAIDNYINLMRIKAEEKAENKELERQIKIAKLKLSTFAIDLFRNRSNVLRLYQTQKGRACHRPFCENI